MKSVKTALNIVGILCTVLFLILATLFSGIKLFGFNVCTVMSADMEPSYPKGSLVYIKVVPVKSINPGDPIAFMPYDRQSMEIRRVVTVISAENETRFFTTKADASDRIDPYNVSENSITGIPFFCMPYMGYVQNWVRHYPGMYLYYALLLCGAALLIVPELIYPSKKSRGWQ